MRDGSEFILVPFVEMGPPARYTPNRSFFGLFDNTKKVWIYDRQSLSTPEEGASASQTPIVDRENIYLSSLATVSSYDLMSGKAVWKKRLTDENTGIWDFTLAGNKILAAVQNGTIYCLDAATGSIKWNIRNGASSDLFVQNGVLYWISGENLLAADLETGKLIWNLSPPDKNEKPSGSNFAGFVTGTEGNSGNKGRIYVTTNLNAYCFDAAR
jgi:outer membrane protein assembly factor BamB